MFIITKPHIPSLLPSATRVPPSRIRLASQASKVMARRAVTNPKIEILWEHEVVEAFGSEDGALGESFVIASASRSAGVGL